jgi:NADPH2:quinone reductase
MKAAWFEEFGTATDVLNVSEIETPVAQHGEVLVRLACSSINPSDVKKRAGSFPTLLDEGPVIPNSDGAGVVEAVGEGVPASRVGERVWIYQAQFARRFGTAAEYVAIDTSRAPRLADAASFEEGACFGIPVMTAHRCVFADGDVDGMTLLVTGGAGRVGHYAIQWASQSGARVIATASNEADRRAVEEAGADIVVDHREGNWGSDVLDATAGQLVDRVVEVEFGANLPTVVDLVRVGGTIATYSSTVNPEPALPFFQMMYKDLTVRFVIVYAMPEDAKMEAIGDIALAAADGKLQHRIAETLPLDEIVRGNELVETVGTRGAVILSMT